MRNNVSMVETGGNIEEDLMSTNNMEKLFEHFEDAEAVIYVTNADTNELIYLNDSLKQLLETLNGTKLSGQKCFEILQSTSTPCALHSNEELLSREFKIRGSKNLILNQRFTIKDKNLEFNGHRYHAEVVVEQDQPGLEKAECHLARRESVLNECLQIFFDSLDPEKSLENLLHCLGKKFHAHRAYIFEINEDGTASNTYEWTADEVTPQKEFLQNIPLSDIRYWIQAFTEENTVLIRDLEEIHRKHPSTYSLLKPQGILSLVVGPICEYGQLKGFIGLDDPDEKFFFLLDQVLRELGKYMVPQLKRRDLYKRFNQMSYHDTLTGAYNRNAILEHTSNSTRWRSFGAVYCDINGLQETNSAQGHDAGNALIRECYQMMQKSMHTEWIYRVGGDEFVAIYHNVDQCIIKQDIDAFRLAILQSICQVSVGSAWTDESPIQTAKILDQAAAEMSREKNLYYALMEMDKTGTEAHQTTSGLIPTEENDAGSHQKGLRQFLSNAYCDVAFLLSVLGEENKTSYFFFGDLQQNVYYISENMRVAFGYASNIIPDLIHVWASRIEDPDLLAQFWRDIDAMLTKKQKCHDLRYQVRDANDNKIWIRCYGQVKWSADGTIPLFFAGRLSRQDEDFVVDPLTNFPTEAVLIKKLENIQNTKKQRLAIGFSLHSLTQINANYGRDYGDDLICKITTELADTLSREMTFYRLSGMRFLGLMESNSINKAEKLRSKIQGIIDDVYHSMEVTLPTTCSFVLLRCLQDGVSPQELLENALSLMKMSQQTLNQLWMDDSIDNLQKIKQLAAMESRLIENVLHDMKNFRIVIQPVVSTETNLPVGGETLLRWQDDGKTVSPGLFIPMLEQANMIHLVGRWVLEQAVCACTRLITLMPDFYLTVNISLQQLEDDGFLSFIRQTLEKYRLDGNHIVLELTESCMDSQPEKLEAFVEECAKMDLRIALDDFGSGYSSMRVLLRYPSNIIKLDRSLLLEMGDSDKKNSFIASIVYACHQFGKKVCMEGVETEFQNELVKTAGCDLIQGFYYYKPMELDAVYQLVGDPQVIKQGGTL